MVLVAQVVLAGQAQQVVAVAVVAAELHVSEPCILLEVDSAAVAVAVLLVVAISHLVA